MTATSGAEIQIDAGEFVRLHNSILEKMALARLSGAEFRALMFLFRKTYGWNKKEDRISLSQWAEGTNGKRPHVLRTLNELIRKRVIYRIDDQQPVPVYGFNKYFEQWLEVFDIDSARGQRFASQNEVLPTQVTVTNAGNTTVTSIDNTDVTSIGNTTVTKTGTHKRNPKDTIKETVKEKIIDSDFGAAVTRYERGMGVISRDMREQMVVMWDALKAQGVTAWWDLAIETAKSYGAYSWPYVSKVLERSLASEKPPTPKQNGNGTAPPAPKPAKRKQRIILPDGETAEVEV